MKKKGVVDRILIVLISFLVSISFSSTNIVFAQIQAVTDDVPASGGIEDDENAKALYAHILGRGGTDWWASAAVGNSYAEHNCDASIDESEGYWGAFQMSHDNLDDYKSWCSDNGRTVEDIISQYDYFIAEYRTSCCKGFVGLDPDECEKDITYIKDAESAAAYFALGMEGCICYKGVTYGEGAIQDSFHDEETRCGTYTFPTKYGKVCLQDLKKRIPNTTVAYNAFSGKVAPAAPENGNVDENGNEKTPTEIQSFTGGYYSEEQLSSFIKLREDNIQSDYLDNATRDNLSQSDLSNLANWEDNAKNSKREYGFIAWMRIIVMWLGIIFTIYIFLLYLAYWFDKLNSIIDLDVLSIMTFGRLHVAIDDKEANFSLGKKQDRMTVNHKDMLFICITGLIFGTLLITGVFYKIVTNFVNMILRWIG